VALHDAIAARATTLLNAIASGDTSAVQEYETLLFPILRDVALRRGQAMAGDVAAKLGLGPSSDVRTADLEQVAAMAAQLALQRARASALRFDPDLGDGASWALGALGYAYVDAVRQIYGTRRVGQEIPSESDTIGERLPEGSDPLKEVEARDELRRVLATLDEDERYVVLAHLHYGFSYREIALYRFGNEGLIKKVDRLLQSARAKIRSANDAWSDG
jgi:DNA-directed RNA polymerase specialized sigma24 family protein